MYAWKLCMWRFKYHGPLEDTRELDAHVPWIADLHNA
jgi:hypothetical protein